MGYRMINVFCAAPVELEQERQSLYAAVAECNEQEAMRSGIVFVPLSLPPELADKERVQSAVDNNIGLAHYFVALLHESWGPAQRNFERDYRLAVESGDRPDRPMRTVAVGL